MKELDKLYISFHTKGLEKVRDNIKRLDSLLNGLAEKLNLSKVSNSVSQSITSFNKLEDVLQKIKTSFNFNDNIDSIKELSVSLQDLKKSMNFDESIDIKKINKLSVALKILKNNLNFKGKGSVFKIGNYLFGKNKKDNNKDDDDDGNKKNLLLSLLTLGKYATVYTALFVALRKIFSTIKNGALDVIKTSEDFNYLSKEIGVSIEKLQEFSNAEKLVGGSGSGIINLLKSLNSGIVSMKYGELPSNFELAMKRYSRYGLDLFRNKDSVSLMNNIAKTISNIKNAEEKADLASILGIDDKTLRLMLSGTNDFNKYLASGKATRYLTEASGENMAKGVSAVRNIKKNGKKILGSGISGGMNILSKLFNRDDNSYKVPDLEKLNNVVNYNIDKAKSINNSTNNKTYNNTTDNKYTTNNINISVNKEEDMEDVDYLLELLKIENRGIK